MSDMRMMYLLLQEIKRHTTTTTLPYIVGSYIFLGKCGIDMQAEKSA